MKLLRPLSLLLTILYSIPWLWSYLHPQTLYARDSQHEYFMGNGAIMYYEYDMGFIKYEFWLLGLPLLALTTVLHWPRRKPPTGFPILPHDTPAPPQPAPSDSRPPTAHSSVP